MKMSLGIDNEYGTIGKDAIDQVDRLLLNNRLLQIFVGVVLILLLILTFGYFSLSSERTSHIMMPPYGEFEVAKMRADPLYYRVWGDFVLARFASFTPSTIKENLAKSSEIFEKNTYLQRKADFDNYLTAVITNNITQTFRYDDNEVIVELKNGGSVATVTYNGYATQSISNITKITKKCFYKFGFYISDYKIYQDSISTDCLNNDSIHHLTEEEKVIEDKDPDATARKAQQELNDQDIDNRVIQRENLEEGVKEKAEFEKERIQKKKEKLLDADYILSGVGDNTKPQEGVEQNSSGQTPNQSQAQEAQQNTQQNSHLQQQGDNAKVTPQENQNTQQQPTN